jgi:glycosyltransferase involved in cell wall biosynthesis
MAKSSEKAAAMISILILTKDEEEDLPGCLASVAWSDDVHVFDSFSSDQTVAIAEGCGAKVKQRVFDDYAAHRNAAMISCRFKYPWVFLLDADERVTPGLVQEMQRVVLETPEEVAGYKVRRRDFLWDRWLKHAQISPFYIRLVRPERAHYTRAINEVLQVAGEVRDLSQPLDHYPFSKGMARWLQKHNTYSTMEAELIARDQGLQDPSWKTALRSKDFHERRLHQKALFYRLPARPLVKWLYMMLARQAFLDGAPGVVYATLQAFYEYMIVLKTHELRLRTDRQ